MLLLLEAELDAGGGGLGEEEEKAAEREGRTMSGEEKGRRGRSGRIVEDLRERRRSGERRAVAMVKIEMLCCGCSCGCSCSCSCGGLWC